MGWEQQCSGKCQCSPVPCLAQSPPAALGHEQDRLLTCMLPHSHLQSSHSKMFQRATISLLESPELLTTMLFPGEWGLDEAVLRVAASYITFPNVLCSLDC